MAKKLRFTELVRHSGKPEPLVLWSKPETNPALQKAIRENRVLTVVQEPSSHKRDYGLFGFHQHQHASYLIFPQPLPAAEPGATVIGINYDLLLQPTLERASAPSVRRALQSKEKPNQKPTVQPKRARAQKTERLPPAAQPRPQPPPAPVPAKPALKKYAVVVSRSAAIETQLLVEAPDIASAQAKALEKVQPMKFRPAHVQAEVTAIKETD